jgi:arylsulfatase
MNGRRKNTASDLSVGAWLFVGSLVLVALGLIGVGLMGYSGGSPTAELQSAPSSTTASTTLGPVEPGAGVYTAERPEETTATAAAAVCADCDVVLLTLCSLRKDHVGAYGVVDVQTPHLDQVALQGARFEHAYAASNFTLASLTAVLTGRFGSRTGVTGWDKGLTKDVPTLPEVLGHYGFKTGGFTTDAPSGFRPDYGLDRGFQHLEITPPPPGTPDGRHLVGTVTPGAVLGPAGRWLAKQSADEPVFLMVHTRTAHFPFVVDAEGAESDESGITQLLFDAGKNAAVPVGEAMPGMAGGTATEGVVKIAGPDPLQVQVSAKGAPAEAMWRQRYREAVERTDDDMAAMWRMLEARGRLDKTILVVVADHGESLNDHDELLHGDAFFDGVINVPLLFRVPGFAPIVSDALVSQVDILPTILALVGAVVPANVDGVSLVPLLNGTKTQVRSATLSEGGVARQSGPELAGAVIAPPWKLLRQQRGCGGPAMGSGMPVCLYNMDDDPDQNRDVSRQNPSVVTALTERWAGFQSAAGATNQRLDLSPAFIETLQKSGYDFRPAAP